jgi:predicted aspartyl protease
VWGTATLGLRIRLAIDTAATETLLRPSVLERLGYDVADAEQITVIQSALGRERGYLMRVSRLQAIGSRARTVWRSLPFGGVSRARSS